MSSMRKKYVRACVCLHISAVPVCFQLCACSHIFRFCLCVSLFIYCIRCVHGVWLCMCAPHDRWRAPSEDLERREEQGTDVFQVEKRQQNLFKVLSKAPLLSLCWSIIEWANVYSQSHSMKTFTNRHALCFLGPSLKLCLINIHFHVSDKYPFSLK